MKIIELHAKNNNVPIYININRIQSFSKSFQNEDSTIMNLDTDDGYYELVETPEEILELIKEVENED